MLKEEKVCIPSMPLIEKLGMEKDEWLISVASTIYFGDN